MVLLENKNSLRIKFEFEEFFYFFKLLLDKECFPAIMLLLTLLYEVVLNIYYLDLSMQANSNLGLISSSFLKHLVFNSKNEYDSDYYFIVYGLLMTVYIIMILIAWITGKYLMTSFQLLNKKGTCNSFIYVLLLNVYSLVIIFISKTFLVTLASFNFLVLIRENNLSFDVVDVLLFILIFSLFSLLVFISVTLFNKINYYNQNSKSCEWSVYNNDYELYVVYKKLLIAFFGTLKFSPNVMLILIPVYAYTIKKKLINCGFINMKFAIPSLICEVFEFMTYIGIYLNYLDVIVLDSFEITIITITSIAVSANLIFICKKYLLKNSLDYKFYYWIYSIMNLHETKCKIYSFGLYSEHVKTCKNPICSCWKLSSQMAKSINKLVKDNNYQINAGEDYNIRNFQIQDNIDQAKSNTNTRSKDPGGSRNNFDENNNPLSSTNLQIKGDNNKVDDIDKINSKINKKKEIEFNFIASDNEGDDLIMNKNNFKENRLDFNFEEGVSTSIYSKRIWIELWSGIFTEHASKLRKKAGGFDNVTFILIMHMINLMAYETNNPYQAIIEIKDLNSYICENSSKKRSLYEYISLKFYLFMLEENIKNLIIQNQINDSVYYKMFNTLTNYCQKYEIFLTNLIEVNNKTMKFLLYIFDKKRSQIKNSELIINRLNEMNNEINKLTFETLESFHNIVELGYEDYKVYYLYSKFFEHVYLIPIIKNEFEEKFEFALKLYFSQNKNNSTLTNDLETKIKLKNFDNPFGTGIIIISGNAKDLGNIKYVNNYLQKISGFVSSELINKNINLIMPDNIGKYHNLYLKNFFKTENSSVLDHMRMIVLKRKDKFIVLIDILVKIYPSFNNGLNFIGYILEKSFNSSESYVNTNVKNGVIFLNEDNYICGISPEIAYSTNFLPELIPKTIYNKKNCALNYIGVIIKNIDELMHETLNNFSYEKINVNRFTFKMKDMMAKRGYENNHSRSKSKLDYSNSEVSETNTNIEKYGRNNSNLSFLTQKNKVENFSKNIGGVLAEIEEMYENDNLETNEYNENLNSKSNQGFIEIMKKLNENYSKDLYFKEYELSFYCKLRELRIEKNDRNMSLMFVKIYLKRKNRKKVSNQIKTSNRGSNNTFNKSSRTDQNRNNESLISNPSILTENNENNNNNNNNNSNYFKNNSINNINPILPETNVNVKKAEVIRQDSHISGMNNLVHRASFTANAEIRGSTTNTEDEEKQKMNNNKLKYLNSLKLTDLGVKVKNIKHEGVKNLIKIFRSFDLNINNHIFSRLTLIFKFVSLITIVCYILIYFYFSNTTNNKEVFLKKKMLYMDYFTSLSSKAEIFYSLILLGVQIDKYETLLKKYKAKINNISIDDVVLGNQETYDYDIYSDFAVNAEIKQINLDPTLTFKNIYEARDVLTTFMKNYTSESNIDILRAMELPDRSSKETEFLHSENVEIFVLSSNYEISTKNTSLIKALDYYNYQFRKILNIETESLDLVLYEEYPKYDYTFKISNFYDFSIDENIETVDIFMNISYSLISYINTFIENLIIEKDLEFNNKNVESIIYLACLSSIIFLTSLWLGVKLNSLLLNNKKILHLFMNLNSNLIKKRLKVLANFTALLNKFINLNFLNAKIKTDFLYRIEQKKLKKKLMNLKKKNNSAKYENLESTGSSVSSMSSQSSMSMDDYENSEADIKVLNDLKMKLNTNADFKTDLMAIESIQKTYGKINYLY